MLETIGAVGTLAGIVLLYRGWRRANRQRDILLRDLATVARLNRQLHQIVVAHGCAPDDDVRPAGSTHTCEKCATTWTANDFEVRWLDDGLKNQISQSWYLSEQGDAP